MENERLQKQAEVSELKAQVAELQTRHKELGARLEDAEQTRTELQQALAREADLTVQLERAKVDTTDRESALLAQCEVMQKKLLTLEQSAATAKAAAAAATAVTSGSALAAVTSCTSCAALDRSLSELQEKYDECAAELARRLSPPATQEKQSQHSSMQPQQSSVEQAPSPEIVVVEEQGQLVLSTKRKNLQEEEASRLRLRLQDIEAEMHDMERTVQLHEMQERSLKDHIRRLDKLAASASPNLEYVKNVVLKYMETNDFQNLAPVIAGALNFSQEDLARIAKINAARSQSVWSYSTWQ
eukprot:TRINITY_DN2566_c0_g1_i2.p3 TRINITY_DN2566_c0_g1~~TRINITY_DN2566_c0_g1_i2.p3  ORF type:complete len:300 (-),score=104.44 TRINITY_DN2566_c0_g1_i2:89-988(-)